jgi:hypothetical protein
VNLLSRCQGRFQWRREQFQRALAQGQLGWRRLARHGVVEQDDGGVRELEREEKQPGRDLGAGGYAG